jgi:hypothetical protein
MVGRALFESKIIEENINEVIRNSDPACDNGIEPGDEG